MPFYPFASGSSGANLNLDNAEEPVGINTDGTATTVTAGASNALGTYQDLGTTAAAWAGFWIYYGPASASSSRMLLNLRINGTTVIVPNLYLEPNQAVGPMRIFIPLAVAAGTLIAAAVQAATGAQTVKVGLVGIVRNAQSAPMYTSMTALNVDTTNTRAATADVAAQNSAGATYTTLSASLAADYHAFLFSPGHNGTNPATSQAAKITFATGAAAAEVEFGFHATWINNSSSAFPSRPLHFIERTILAGVRLSTKCAVVTPGTDAIRVAAYGFA